jgi:hypothetical protein
MIQGSGQEMGDYGVSGVSTLTSASGELDLLGCLCQALVALATLLGGRAGTSPSISTDSSRARLSLGDLGISTDPTN